MNKRSIIEIMDDMDRLEKIEISDELIDTLKDYFEEEINCCDWIFFKQFLCRSH